MLKPKIQFKWTKINPDAILKTLNAIAISSLAELKVPIQAVIDRNIGTQYFSLEALKQLRHPYRIGGGGRPGGLPAGVVNRQSGNFHKSIIIRGPLLLGKDRVAITIFSRGDKAKGDWLLGGTSRMMGRPWTSHLKTEIYKIAIPIINKTMKSMRLRVKV